MVSAISVWVVHPVIVLRKLGPAVLILGAVGVCLFLKLNREAKRVIRELYDIDSEEFLWNSTKFADYNRNLLKFNLNTRGYRGAEKLDLLMTMLKDLAGRQRFSGSWFWGTLVALFISVWARILQVSFPVSHALIHIPIIIGIYVILSMLFLLAITMIRTMALDIVNRKYRMTMDLINDLEDIRLNI